MSKHIPPDAVSVRQQKPRPHERVLGYVSDRSVAIEHEPLVVWLTHSDGWWGGLPGSYLNLTRLKWRVTHWKRLP